MALFNQNQTVLSPNENLEKQWQSMYRLGVITALIAILGTIFDIIIGSSLGGDLSTIPNTAIDRFAQFRNNWLLGLYNLDLLNVCTTILMIPTYFAIVAAHRRGNMTYAILGTIIYYIGAAIFITNNSALAMLDLSNKYAVASATQKSLLAAAGEALLARGAHGSPGAFTGFIFSTIGSLTMSIGMLKGNVFNRLTSCLGILGSLLLLTYLLLVTFIPEIKNVAVMVAAPGGLLALAWTIMFTIKLYQLSRSKVN